MNAIYTEEEVLNILAEGDMDANELLNSIDPNFEKRFKRLNTALSKLLDDVRKTFPDAQYYSPSDGLALLLGSSHRDAGIAQQELAAVYSNALCSVLSGGDW
ncbi:hypothetical protein AWW72_13245 [Acinetobacter sp. NRRL B-65365]|uniref:hypothetical protein n=1 Tax=Acinetobacter sp. NRRL B-65365 TaxID=1785092 RepID=UPI0007A07DFD|nr:hypothetical protein [Acinetobacter sp. NRRL B-65365]KYQ83548.1 hypothetical protein AWW72_13245 [Acinetobacter sp. NRRL B-65365]